MISSFARRHGLPEALVGRWMARGVRQWTGLQEAAWAAGMMESREDWLVGGPTSAGKGVLAEIVAARHLLEGERVVWLVPTRALAESFAATLGETFSPLGLKVICATRERPESDPLLAAGRFDLCVAVPEKALAWLAAQPHGLAGVGLVIADELSLLRDADRGGRFDLLLTRIMNSPYKTRRIGLCLPVPNIHEVAAWWGGRLLLDTARPRPLREGVFEAWSGRWRWRDRTSGESGSEGLVDERRWADWRDRFAPIEGLAPSLAETAALAAALASRGEPTLLFVPTRGLARRLAELFIECKFAGPSPCMFHAAKDSNHDRTDQSVLEPMQTDRGLICRTSSPNQPPALRSNRFAVPNAKSGRPNIDPASGCKTQGLLQSVRRLARREPSIDHKLLGRAIPRGVGIHHADISTEARRMVEDALAHDRLPLTIATPTLAQGLNFSAINVIHLPWQVGEAGGPELPLERWRFADQGGRAGRFGRGESAGRSILVASTPPRAEALWRRYMIDPIEPLRSRLTPDDAAAGVLLALTGGAARTSENIEHEFGSTFAAQCGMPMPSIPEAIVACRIAGLMNDAESIRLTGLGQVAAVHGLAPKTVSVLSQWIGDSAIQSDEPLPKLLALTFAAPAGLWPARTRTPRQHLLADLVGWFESRGFDCPTMLSNELSPAELAAIEVAGRMLAWIGPEPVHEIENRTGWTAGMLARAGENLAWLARAAAAVEPARGDAWRSLATRLQSGITIEAEPLGSLRIEGLGRSAMQALAGQNVCDASTILETSHKRLAQIVGDAALAKRIRAVATQATRRIQKVIPVFAQRTELSTQNLPVSLPESGRSPDLPSIEIDLQSPGVVRVGGRDVQLAPLGFDLLAALAERPGSVVTRAALYQKLWPDGGPEDQQLDAHRRRLSRALAEVLDGAQPIEVVRGSGFRLRCEEGQVLLRRG